MARLFHPNQPLQRRKYPVLILALSYFAGLLFGVFVFRFAGDRLDSLMRGALTGAVSIVGLLGVTVVPFLFSAFAVSLSKPALLFPVSFINAFLFCFVSLRMMRCAGSAGWLIRWLLCFSGSVFAPVLYLYWQRHLTRPFSGLEAAGMLSLCLLIGSIDYRLISPFWARLING